MPFVIVLYIGDLATPNSPRHPASRRLDPFNNLLYPPLKFQPRPRFEALGVRVEDKTTSEPPGNPWTLDGGPLEEALGGFCRFWRPLEKTPAGR